MSRITDIEKEIELLKAEKEKLLQEEKEQSLIKNWEELQNRVTHLTEEQIFFEWLNPKTKTIPLFDRFYAQQKEFLCLTFTSFSCFTKILSCWDWSARTPVSLIIIKNWKAIKRKNRTLTVSELKKYTDCNLNYIDYYDKTPLRDLFEEINGCPRSEFEKAIKNKGFYTEKYYPLSKPISIGAQISKNRKGYGNIYNGEILVREGTKYGETTEFLIVGVRVGSCKVPFLDTKSL